MNQKRVIAPGMKFHQLTVVREDSVRNLTRWWLCQCECGSETIVSIGKLGTTKTCGCGRRRRSEARPAKSGRYRRGENNSQAKLRQAQVVEIRSRAARGEHEAYLASEFGINMKSVASICRGKTWKEAGGLTREKRRICGEAQGLAKLQDDQIREIRSCAAQGERQKSLASRFGVVQTCISAIIRRKTWRHIQ